MKIRVPAKTVEACDICKRECAGSLLTTCITCGQQYCHTCEAIICGCIHQPDICKRCADQELIRKVVSDFAPKIQCVLKLRDQSLKMAFKPLPTLRPATKQK